MSAHEASCALHLAHALSATLVALFTKSDAVPALHAVLLRRPEDDVLHWRHVVVRKGPRQAVDGAPEAER